MAVSLSSLTVPALDAVRRERKAAADAAFLAATNGGEVVPAAAMRRRVDALTARWEATLDEYERRGLLVGQ